MQSRDWTEPSPLVAVPPRSRSSVWRDWNRLGVTEAGQFVVVELKVHHADGSRGNSPMAALVEALRYAAIVQANHSDIAKEARAKFSVHVSDEAVPAIVLLGTEEWWRSWLTLRAAGSWTIPFLPSAG